MDGQLQWQILCYSDAERQLLSHVLVDQGRPLEQRVMKLLRVNPTSKLMGTHRDHLETPQFLADVWVLSRPWLLAFILAIP